MTKFLDLLKCLTILFMSTWKTICIEFRCLCGCGEYTKLPMKGFYPEASGHWSFVAPNSINPSIDKHAGCKSHLSLKNGIVD